jgi:hypothetical protein
VSPCGFTPHCGDCGETNITLNDSGMTTCCDALVCPGSVESAAFPDSNDQT